MGGRGRGRLAARRDVQGQMVIVMMMRKKMMMMTVMMMMNGVY